MSFVLRLVGAILRFVGAGVVRRWRGLPVEAGGHRAGRGA